MSAVARVLLILIAVVVALFVAYTWVVLHWSYSEGERAGYVQKLSRKGWLCKTWEGEVALVTMPGTVAEKFIFSVRDDAVAEQINKSLGKRVSLIYEEHIGVPTTCFAETSYFVTGVKVIDDPAPIGPGRPGPLPPAPTPGAAPAPQSQSSPPGRPAGPAVDMRRRTGPGSRAAARCLKKESGRIDAPARTWLGTAREWCPRNRPPVVKFCKVGAAPRDPQGFLVSNADSAMWSDTRAHDRPRWACAMRMENPRT
jgi:hypothetical protein